MPSTRTAQSLKEAALSFLTLAASDQVREAYDRFVAPGFRHHNPHFRGDAASLAFAMAQNAKENPDKVFEAKHVVADGDLVAVHRRVRMKPDSQDFALFHLFRFADGRIVELWDVAQPAPSDSVNQYGMF